MKNKHKDKNMLFKSLIGNGKCWPNHITDKEFMQFSVLYSFTIHANGIVSAYIGSGKTKIARWMLLQNVIKTVDFKPVNICQYLRKEK